MEVSYSMVKWLCSDVSSTAPRQHSGYQNRLVPKGQPPLIRKVRSGAVSNASQLKILLELDLIIWVIKNIPKKERSRSVNKGESPFFSGLIGWFAWTSLWSISPGLRMAVLWSIEETKPWEIR